MTVFILNQFAQSIGISSHFTVSYLDDILCIPIVLLIVQFVHRKINDVDFILPISHVVITVIFFSIIFEILLPSISTKFIGDYIDILFYSVGAIIYYYYSKIQRVLTPAAADVKSR